MTTPSTQSRSDQSHAAPSAGATRGAQRAPGTADPHTPRQATAGMPPAHDSKALETGARGWRWVVISLVLALAPCTVLADATGQATSLATGLADVHLERGAPLVTAESTLHLGTPLVTFDAAQRHLRAAAVVRAPSRAWADLYFAGGTDPAHPAPGEALTLLER